LRVAVDSAEKESTIVAIGLEESHPLQNAYGPNSPKAFETILLLNREELNYGWWPVGGQ